MMPRHVWALPGGMFQRGVGTGRCEAAGAGRTANRRPGGHHRPRGIEGTQPGRISLVWNVETPSGSERPRPFGGLTVRKVDLRRDRMAKKPMPVGRKATG